MNAIIAKRKRIIGILDKHAIFANTGGRCQRTIKSVIAPNARRNSATWEWHITGIAVGDNTGEKVENRFPPYARENGVSALTPFPRGEQE